MVATIKKGAEGASRGGRDSLGQQARQAGPIQSTGTPAEKHSDSPHHRQGQKIFHKGGSKYTDVKKATSLEYKTKRFKIYKEYKKKET